MYIYKVDLVYMNQFGASKATPKNCWRAPKGPRCVGGAMQVGCNVQNALFAYKIFYILTLSLKAKMTFFGACVYIFMEAYIYRAHLAKEA